MPDTSVLLAATADVMLADPCEMQQYLARYFSEFGDVDWQGPACTLSLAFGTVNLSVTEGQLRLRAESKDEAALAHLKLAMAGHLLARAGAPAPRLVWRGHGEAGSPLPYFREMRVAARASITPHVMRLTLTGADLGRFALNGLHVKLLIPQPGSRPGAWPVMGEDGRPFWPTGALKPVARAYTIRRIDVASGEVDIDFVQHDGADMPGANFARTASIGEAVGMTGPGGGSVGAADWYLLAGDETALPAIARILETLPATARVVARIEVANAAECQPLASAAQVDMQWLMRGDQAAGTTTLLPDALREVEWPAEPTSVFAWVGCEHAAARLIRSYLREERGLARAQHLCAAYWRRGMPADAAGSTD